jgi:hypothetical protein
LPAAIRCRILAGAAQYRAVAAEANHHSNEWIRSMCEKRFVASILITTTWFGCSDDPSPAPDAAVPDAAVPDAMFLDAPPGFDPCPLDIEDEAAPGFPFDFQRFKADIWPDLQASCGTSGCHLAPAGHGDTPYNVWPATNATCPDVQSFKAFYERVDFRTHPANSLLLRNMDGTDPHTPSFAGSPLLAELRDFVQAGYVEYTGGESELTGFFDEAVYAQQIQPVIDSLGCAGAGCHDLTDRAGTLGLNPSPAPGSPAMEENFARLTTYVDPDAGGAEGTALYVRLSDRHGGIAFGVDALTVARGWIQGALGKAPASSCAPMDAFDGDWFRDEIKPLIEGRVDYNDISNGHIYPGCARSECHGSNRGAGTLHIDPAGTPEQQLDSLRCFVDLQHPSASQALLCPLNLSGCRTGPHPGADPFFGVDDRNYQKLLSFIYASGTGAAPLDFAFFARKIDPIFNDPNAVQDGMLGLTCASPGCHGSQGDPVDNGSNFAIVPGATDQEELFMNFIAASGFVYAPDAGRSSLLMYPTDRVADANDPSATGLHHPGGACFALDEPEAIDMLEFTSGLRPNAQAFLQDFLVAGLFGATDVTDEAVFMENSLEPTIFDRSGQGEQFNQGRWDGFFSPGENVDLLQAFQVDDATGALAYAVAYAVNTTASELDIVVTVDSENDVELFVGAIGAVGRNGQGVSVSAAPLPPFADTKEVTRIMLKVFQQAGEASFAFDMQFTDDNGNLLTDATRELVFVLSPRSGGI